MPEGPQLPQPIDDLQKEAARIQAKREAARQNGAAAAVLQALDEQINGLKAAIAQAIIEDAKREIAEAKGNAQMVKAGDGPVAVAPNGDQQRIAALEQEIARIKQKLAKAKQNGATPAQLQPFEQQIKDLKKAIARAALAAARREVREAKQEARDIEGGKPKPKPPEQGPGPQPPGGGGGAGGGGAGASGDGGGGDGGGGGMVLGAGGSRKEPDAYVIYVKSERTVWAWSRRDQAWVAQRFTSKLLEVRLIKNGIFAIAEHGAALFDAVFGRWLAVLDTAQETVVGGDAGT